MVFSSPIFLFLFLPVVLLMVSFVPTRLKNLILLVASLFFYAWGERFFTVVMLGSIGWNYVMALLLDSPNKGQSKIMLIIGIAGNLLAIGYFKYANFIIENLNYLLAGFSLHISKVKDLHLPIGISFFTFQSMSYLIDVYRKVTQANKNPVAVALYVSLFPQLIAGPIVRYVDVEREIKTRTITSSLFAAGIERFIIGLAKKVILANTFAYVADQVFSFPPSQTGTALAWLGIICYTLQIYFDFSGYSDMAIGLGKMLGFHFLENFNYPYIASSIKDFWRRWHISLSTWFRDYLYIPLGGNRVPVSRIYVNLMIVFFLTGLWHGASWNFIIWGLFHGAFLVIERLGFDNLLEKAWKPIRHIYTLMIVIIGWVFFRAENLDSAFNFLSKMFIFQSNAAADSHLAMLINYELWLMLTLGMLFSMPVLKFVVEKIQSLSGNWPSKVWIGTYDIALISTFVLTCIYLAAGTYNPFIYYRF